MTRLPATASEPVPEIASSESALSWWGRFASRPAYALRSLAAIGAIGVVLLGAAPMVRSPYELRWRPPPHRGDKRQPRVHERRGCALQTRRPGRKLGQPGRSAGKVVALAFFPSARPTALSSPKSSPRPTGSSVRAAGASAAVPRSDCCPGPYISASRSNSSARRSLRTRRSAPYRRAVASRSTRADKYPTIDHHRPSPSDARCSHPRNRTSPRRTKTLNSRLWGKAPGLPTPVRVAR